MLLSGLHKLLKISSDSWLTPSGDIPSSGAEAVAERA